jgi:dihydrofolate reductase
VDRSLRGRTPPVHQRIIPDRGCLPPGPHHLRTLRRRLVSNHDENDQIAQVLNSRPKYVASTTLTDPAWHGTRLLSADVARDVTELKAQPGNRIALIGSSRLAHHLIRHDLIDEYELYVHPVVLGRGKRLFPEDAPASTLRVVDSRTTGSGLVILTYERMQSHSET